MNISLPPSKMLVSLDTRYAKNSVLQATEDARTSEASTNYPKHFEMNVAEERLLNMKAQMVVEELVQISSFAKACERFWLGDSSTSAGLSVLIERLKQGKGRTHAKIVRMIATYLNGIRGFSGGKSAQDAILFARLLESTMRRIFDDLEQIERGETVTP